MNAFFMEYIDMYMFLTAAGLAQLVERLTAERRSRVRFPGPDQHSGS